MRLNYGNSLVESIVDSIEELEEEGRKEISDKLDRSSGRIGDYII